MFKVNNKDTRKTSLTFCRLSGVFGIKFEHISNLFLTFLSMTLNKYMFAGIFSLIT